MSTAQSHPERQEGIIRVEEVDLPGVGLRHDFVTHRGRRVGVISHRSGRRELLVYDLRDPDACSETVLLNVEEADTLSELLGAPRILERLAALHEQVATLVSEQLTVEVGSPYEGKTLGDTQARTLTGASVVAVLRGGEVVASPGPDFRFQAGDGEGVEGVAQILSG
jgi:TrkA domain protein